MIFIGGMVAGAVIALVVFVAYMAPKHWEWYQENIDLRAALVDATEARDHYKNLVRPNDWGAAAQHEARIVRKPKPYDTGSSAGEVSFRFDDIKDGGDR